MAEKTFPTGIPALSSPLSVKIKPRVRGVNYGDGYSSRSPDGINTMILTGQELVWNLLGETDKDSLIDFFEECAGIHYFVYTLPSESSSRKLRPSEWNWSYNKTNFSVSVTVDEVP